jgi:hypothetical protein
MMRWRLDGDWPVGGQYCIEKGTTLEAVVGTDGEIVENSFVWNGIVLPPPPPINAWALDDAARVLLKAYGPHRHLLLFERGVHVEPGEQVHY